LFAERTFLDMDSEEFNWWSSKFIRMLHCYKLNFIEDQYYSIAYRIYMTSRTNDVVFVVINYTGDTNYSFF
jgi:hypothetical protein